MTIDTDEGPEQQAADAGGAATFSEAQLDELRDEGQSGRGDPIPPETNGPADRLGAEADDYTEAQADGDHKDV